MYSNTKLALLQDRIVFEFASSSSPVYNELMGLSLRSKNEVIPYPGLGNSPRVGFCVLSGR